MLAVVRFEFDGATDQGEGLVLVALAIEYFGVGIEVDDVVGLLLDGPQ